MWIYSLHASLSLSTFVHQKKFSDSFANPDFIISDFAKFDRPSQLHIAFQALDKFRTDEGCMPRPYNKEDGTKFVEISKSLASSGDYKVWLMYQENSKYMWVIGDRRCSVSHRGWGVLGFPTPSSSSPTQVLLILPHTPCNSYYYYMCIPQ